MKDEITERNGLKLASMSEKRARKKSRRLSEAQNTEKEEEEPPKKRKRQQKSETPPQRPKKLVVSLSNSLIGSKTVQKLQRPNKARNGRDKGVKDDIEDETTVMPPDVTKVKFKNPHFEFSSLASYKKKRWRNRKQLMLAERSLAWKHDDPTYSSIDAPPSIIPVKKYSDISGALSKYTDPQTGLYFSTTEEYNIIRTLPSDIIQGYLALRGKATVT